MSQKKAADKEKQEKLENEYLQRLEEKKTQLANLEKNK